MAKKPKEKTLEQLHDEIMDVFVGVSFKNSVSIFGRYIV